MVYCQQCGAELDDNDKRCRKCGAEIIKNQPTTQRLINFLLNHHNIEFILAIIAVALQIFVFQAFAATYNTKYDNIIYKSILSFILGILGALYVRSDHRLGAGFIILSGACFALSGTEDMTIPAIFTIIVGIISWIHEDEKDE